MIFDLDKINDGEWFPFFESRINEKGEVEYDEPKEGAGRVCIRDFSTIIEQQVGKRKKKSEFVLNPVTRSMERVTYFEDYPEEQKQRDNDDVWDYTITAWEGFYDKNGDVIECTRENKIKLMKLPVFDRFVGRCLQMLSNSRVLIKEEAEKNL